MIISNLQTQLQEVPQGGLASPILFNIYMHEFDKYIQNEINNELSKINKHEKRNLKPRNLEYERIQKQIQIIKGKLNRRKKETKFIDYDEKQYRTNFRITKTNSRISKEKIQITIIKTRSKTHKNCLYKIC